MKNALFIEGRRNGYSPKQCGNTMTVRELIEYLEGYADDMPVFLKNDGGYTYGNIDSWSFEEQEESEDEDEDEEE